MVVHLCSIAPSDSLRRAGTDGDQICPSEHRASTGQIEPLNTNGARSLVFKALERPRTKPLKIWAPADERTVRAGEAANGRPPQLVQIHGDLAVRRVPRPRVFCAWLRCFVGAVW